MTAVLALDLSKRSTGFAVWEHGSDTARFGSWVLGSEFTPDGGTYCKLHRQLADLRRLVQFEHLFFEEPLHPAKLQGHTNIDSLRVLSGLAAHAQSYGEAVGLRTVRGVNLSSWRVPFIGSQKRGTVRADLKSMTMERCRQLGFKPRNDDEADALGLLDYAITALGFTPPWRMTNALLPPLSA